MNEIYLYKDFWEKKMKECKTDYERDNITNLFLQCHDPFYSDDRPGKSSTEEYPYHTHNIDRYVRQREVPESSLNVDGTLEVIKKGMAENKTLEY